MKTIKEKLNRVLQVVMAALLLTLISIGFMPVVAHAALGVGESVTFKFDMGGGSCNIDPPNYSFDGNHTYTANDAVVETSSGTSASILVGVDNPPSGKQFIGWQSADGKWIGGSDIPLALLASAENNGEYTFTAVYKDWGVWYNLDGGELSITSDVFLDPYDLSYAFDGLNDNERDTYVFLAAKDINISDSSKAFIGWMDDGGGSGMVESFSNFDFEVTGNRAELIAIYGSSLGHIAYCEPYEGLNNITSISDIPAEALITVDGGVAAYTAATQKIAPVPVPEAIPEGKAFENWNVYAVNSGMSEIANGITVFDTSGKSGDLVFTVNWKRAAGEGDVPNKKGIVVVKNEDGDRTVTLVDGSKYGKKATINTIKGSDKKTYKITRIADNAFRDDTVITKVSIGANVKAVGNNAFDGCSNLKTTTVSKKLESIGDSAFAGCTSLTKISIGKAVKSIGEKAFDGCTSLKTLKIGAGVETIGADAFNGCTSLTSVTIKMMNVPENLFKGNTSIAKLTIGATTKALSSNAFNGCTNLKTASLGKNLESIGDSAFAGCTSLLKANVGKSVTVIGNNAFNGCTSMKSTVIGKSVTHIGAGAYAGNANLGIVSVKSQNLTDPASVGDDFLKGILADAKVKIPKAVFDQTKAVFESKSGAGDQINYVKIK